MTQRFPRRPRLTRAEIERIVELRERGRSEATIARLIGCSASAVSWALLREGVDIHQERPLAPVPTEPVVKLRGGFPVRLFTEADDERIAALEAEGLTVSQIARAMGRRNNSIIGRMRTLARRLGRAEFREIQAEAPNGR